MNGDDPLAELRALSLARPSDLIGTCAQGLIFGILHAKDKRKAGNSADTLVRMAAKFPHDDYVVAAGRAALFYLWDS